MHPQTWTVKDSGEAAVVSYQQLYDKKNMTIYFCTTQNRKPLKPQVNFRNMDISYKSQSKSLGIYHASHHIWNEIKGLYENTKLKLSEAFYVLLTMHPGTTLCKWPTCCTITLQYVYYYNPLHVSSNSVLIFRRSNCINTASGIVFCVCDCPVCRLRRNWTSSFWSCTPDSHLHRILYQMLY